jgi:hypothetical protein
VEVQFDVFGVVADHRGIWWRVNQPGGLRQQEGRITSLKHFEQ